MKELKLTKTAEKNLQLIYNYTYETWGEKQADKYIKELNKKISELASNKMMPSSEHKGNVKSLIFKKHYRIFYKDVGAKVIILEILYQSTNWQKKL